MSALEQDLDIEVTLTNPEDHPDELQWDQEAKQLRRFTVTDMASAEWAIRKIAQKRFLFEEATTLAANELAAFKAKLKLDEIEALIAAESDRLQAFLAGYAADLDHAEEFFGHLLEEWHLQVLADDPKRKTIKLPSGEHRSRKAPDTVEVDDLDAFVCTHGLDSEFVRPHPAPDKPAIKRALADGVPVDGARVVPGEVRFSVETLEPVVPVDPELRREVGF